MQLLKFNILFRDIVANRNQRRLLYFNENFSVLFVVINEAVGKVPLRKLYARVITCHDKRII